MTGETRPPEGEPGCARLDTGESSSHVESLTHRGDETPQIPITGTLDVDLAALVDQPDRMRRRVHGALAIAPPGAEVRLIVGAIAVDVPAVTELRQLHRKQRLGAVHVHGTNPAAVSSWVDALRSPSPLEALGVWAGGDPA